MKKLFILLLIGSLPLSVFAQSKGFRFGGMFGLGEGRIKNPTITSQSGKLAVTGGFGVNYQFRKIFGLYGNLLYTSKGAKADGIEGSVIGTYPYEQTFSFSAIEIPVMPKLSFGFNKFYLKAFAGPSVNFNLSSKEDKVYNNSTYDFDHGYENKDLDVPFVDYSFVFGGGIDWETSEKNIFFLEYRRNKDLRLKSINAVNENTHYYNRYYVFAFGYLCKF
jgi:hypothetical protein